MSDFESDATSTIEGSPRPTQKTTKRQRRTPGLIKRGSIFHIDKVIDGRRLICSTGTGDLEEAERDLAHRVAEHRRVHRYGERPQVTLTEAAAKFLAEYCRAASLQRASECLGHILEHIGSLDITRVHDGVLEDYRKARRTAGRSAGTLNLELAWLGRVLTLAARVWRHPNGRSYIDSAPLLRRETGEVVRKPYPLSWDEQRRLFSKLPAWLAEAALFAVNTGLRQAELCGLRWAWRVNVPELKTTVFVVPGQLRDAEGTLVFATKTRTDRLLVLNSIAQRIVAAREGDNAEHVFAHNGKPLSKLYVHAWTRARKSAGLPNLRVHDLRHTFGHRLRAAGVGLEDRADLLGHAAGRMTTHYSAPDLTRLIEAAETIVHERPATVLRAITNAQA